MAEVAEGPPHLLEGEGEREEAAHGFVRQFAGKTLAAQRRDLGQSRDERLLELGLRRRRPAGRQSHAACPQIVAAGPADRGEPGRQPSLHGLGQRIAARDAADRDHVVAQPQQGAPERLRVRLDREPRRALALAFRGTGGEFGQRLADAVIGPPQGLDIGGS